MSANIQRLANSMGVERLGRLWAVQMWYGTIAQHTLTTFAYHLRERHDNISDVIHLDAHETPRHATHDRYELDIFTTAMALLCFQNPPRYDPMQLVEAQNSMDGEGATTVTPGHYEPSTTTLSPTEKQPNNLTAEQVQWLTGFSSLMSSPDSAPQLKRYMSPSSQEYKRSTSTSRKQLNVDNALEEFVRYYRPPSSWLPLDKHVLPRALANDEQQQQQLQSGDKVILSEIFSKSHPLPLRRSLLYNLVKLSMIDGCYTDEDKRTMRKLVQKIGFDSDTVEMVEKLVQDEMELMDEKVLLLKATLHDPSLVIARRRRKIAVP